MANQKLLWNPILFQDREMNAESSESTGIPRRGKSTRIHFLLFSGSSFFEAASFLNLHLYHSISFYRI